MGYEVKIILGDLTEQRCDAIVNPANGMMVMGGGVAAAIVNKGGKIIEEEARKSVPIKPGMALITHAGLLPCKYVIHAVTMNEQHQATEATVRKSTNYALLIAESNKLRTIAFPAMGMGIGGLDPKMVAESMAEVLRNFNTTSSLLKEVRIVLFDKTHLPLFEETFKKVFL